MIVMRKAKERIVCPQCENEFDKHYAIVVYKSADGKTLGVKCEHSHNGKKNSVFLIQV